ncbi:hypothetical protein PGB90_005434 [Kerria lacca]
MKHFNQHHIIFMKITNGNLENYNNCKALTTYFIYEKIFFTQLSSKSRILPSSSN